MGFNLGTFLAALWGTRTPPVPTVPPAPTTYLFSFLVQDDGGQPLAGVVVSLRLDDGSPSLITTSDAAGQVSYRTTWRGVGVTVDLRKPGYQGTSERRLLPLLSTSGPEPEWPAVTVLHPAAIVVVPPPVTPVPSPEPPAPNPEPSHSRDAIVLGDAVVAARDCPDVRPWPVFATLRQVTLLDREGFERGDTMPEFDGRDQLPPAMGSQGAIAYTLWLGCHIRTVWYILPIVECIGTYVPTGQLLAPGQLAQNLAYFADPPLKGYAPAPGEDVIMFCTTGDTRRQNVHALGIAPSRTTVLKVPWRVGVTTA